MGRISHSLAVLQRALTLLRTLLLIGVLGLILAAGYWVYEIWNEKTVYERYLHNLLGEQRVAEVCILDQQRPVDEPVRTTVRFQEFRQNGQPLSPLVVTLPGEEIYVDAFVTLFERGCSQKWSSQEFIPLSTDLYRTDGTSGGFSALPQRGLR